MLEDFNVKPLDRLMLLDKHNYLKILLYNSFDRTHGHA